MGVRKGKRLVIRGLGARSLGVRFTQCRGDTLLRIPYARIKKVAERHMCAVTSETI